MFGFFPTDKKSQKLSFSRLIMIIVTVVLVVVPLRTSMHAIAKDYRITQSINSTTRDYIEDLHSHIALTNVSYEERQNTIRVNLVLQAPE